MWRFKSSSRHQDHYQSRNLHYFCCAKGGAGTRYRWVRFTPKSSSRHQDHLQSRNLHYFAVQKVELAPAIAGCALRPSPLRGTKITTSLGTSTTFAAQKVELAPANSFCAKLATQAGPICDTLWAALVAIIISCCNSLIPPRSRL